MTTAPFVLRCHLPGPALGLGVDLVRRGRVSDRVAQRYFSAEERASLTADLAFAVREAVIKAVGGVGIPGAPLGDMGATRAGDALRFVPGPRYLPVLAQKQVTAVELYELPFDDVGVLAVACGAGAPCAVSIAVCLARADLADLASLTDEERGVVESRHDPRASIANRLAVRLAARALGASQSLSVRGGGAQRPALVGAESEGGLVSLGHEGDFGVAAVLLPVR